MAGDKYNSYKDLAAAEKQGEDFDFEARAINGSRAVIIAPHGGHIEPSTDQIADAIAGNDFSFYRFRALKKDSNLHIKSHLFDEPVCEKLVATHEHVVSIHGWSASGNRVCIGGLDSELTATFKMRLAEAGIRVEDATDPLKGTDPGNITNRGARSCGVQFELTMAFRKSDNSVKRFIETVRAVLLGIQAPERR